ncbi:hypothetical protein AX14_011908 [Amanita brunnescens Koide BX004]|nr:hypothetical protein AX14_011908 [Amanita brunnescens Koide BX004]
MSNPWTVYDNHRVADSEVGVPLTAKAASPLSDEMEGMHSMEDQPLANAISQTGNTQYAVLLASLDSSECVNAPFVIPHEFNCALPLCPGPEIPEIRYMTIRRPGERPQMARWY